MAVKNNTYNIQEVGLAKALVRKGHQCDIVFWTDKEEEDVYIPVDDKKVIVFYRKGKTFLKNCVYDLDELYSKYDILQAAEYDQFNSLKLAKKYNDKLVIYHGPYFSSFNKRYNLMCKYIDLFHKSIYLKKNTLFITKSNLAKDFLVSKKIKEENVFPIGVGMDKEMLSSDTPNETEFYKQMKKDDSFKLLYIGRIEPRRNILFILDLLRKIGEVQDGVKLYMIGDGDEDYITEVKKYISKNRLTKYVVWERKMEQKYLSQIYEKADAFLLPTEYEIFGMVLLEAMYYRLPVLTTLNGGSSILIKNNESGFILDKENIQSWVDTILDLYQNKQAREKIGESAHKVVANGYTWDALADKFIEVYTKRLGK